jgi:uncharacterized damage-inducible protein DinB
MTQRNYHLNKFQILKHTENLFSEITDLCNETDDQRFFATSEHWSVAENLEHLTLSLKKSWLALYVPKFISRWKFSKPTHSSLTYEELQRAYYQKLEEGAKASKAYIPVLDLQKDTKEKMIARFETAANKYLDQLKYYWEDENIDLYHFPHPVLGNITARELLYFNMFHTTHHYRAMKTRLSEFIEFAQAI